MAERRERVILELDDQFSTKMAKAAAATELLHRELNSLSGTSVQTSRDTDRMSASIGGLGDEIDRTSASTRDGVADIDRYSGRLRLLVDAALMLGPALVPIGALAVPAIAGLASELGAAASGAAVAVLAFQGVGDALKALNQYQIDPTAAHLQKLNETMDALGPAGEIFVRQLQDLRPELQGLQDIAQQGLFPGLSHSIDDLMNLAPEVESIIGTISRALGRLAERGAEELNTDRWVKFIQYLDHEASPTLTAMGQSLGYVVEGLASMMMAFDPLASSFTQGMVRYARAFRDWADGLGQTQGFQDFVAYIQDNGPAAMDALGALADALISLVTAAAPVGAATLPIITALADSLAAIASSPVGPVLVSTAAAVATLGRALALLKVVGFTGNGRSMLGDALNAGSVKTLIPTLNSYTAATQQLQVAEAEAAVAHARYIGSLKANSVASELVPGRAASANMVKVTDELTAANRRQAAAAATVARAEKERSAAIRGTLAGAGKAAAVVAGLAFATSGYAEKSGLANTTSMALMGTIAGPWGAAIGGGVGLAMDFAASNNSMEDSIRRADQAAKTFDLSTMRASLADLTKAMDTANEHLTLNPSLNPVTMAKDNINFVNEFFTNTGAAVAAARDAMQSNIDSMILSVNALGQAFGAQGFGAGKYVDDLDRLTPVLERARPAMEALGISTKDLQKAVENGSINVLVGQIADYTQWMDTAGGRTQRIADAMASLDDQMVSTADSASNLKSALDGLLDPNINLVRATDAWTTALRHLGDDLDKNNKTLRGNSDAAIKNREAINQRVDSMKQLLGAEADAGASSRKLSGDLKAQKAALINAAEAAGISRGEMVNYLKTLGLTPKLVQTLIEAKTDKAKAAIASIKAQLDGIPRSISTTWYVHQVNAVNKGGFQPNPDARGADGMTVPGTRHPYGDKVLAYIAPGEEVISNRHGQADRHRDLLKAINANRLADGGTVGGGLSSFRLFTAGDAAAANDAARALHAVADGAKKEAESRKKLLEHEIERDQKEVDLAKQHRDAIVQDIQSLRQSVTERFRSQVFGQDLGISPDSGISASGLALMQQNAALSTLRQDIADAREARQLYRQLRKMGVHGGALAYAQQNASIDELRALASDPTYARQYERLYGTRQHASGQTGALAADQRYGAALQKATATLTAAVEARKEDTKTLHAIEHRLSEIEKHTKDGPAKTAQGINHNIASGHKGRA